MKNPLTDFSSLPRFGDIRPEHVVPAVAALVAEGRATSEALASAGGEGRRNSLSCSRNITSLRLPGGPSGWSPGH